MLHKRIVPVLVLLLAGWPLLVPPGTCVCQVAQAGECSPETCAAEHSHRGTISDDDAGKSHCGCCDDEDSPTRGQYPPGCPANKRTDHSRLVEQYHPAGADAVAAAPCPLGPEQPHGLMVHGLQRDTVLLARPIYLALCTLLL